MPVLYPSLPNPCWRMRPKPLAGMISTQPGTVITATRFCCCAFRLAEAVPRFNSNSWNYTRAFSPSLDTRSTRRRQRASAATGKISPNSLLPLFAAVRRSALTEAQDPFFGAGPLQHHRTVQAHAIQFHGQVIVFGLLPRERAVVPAKHAAAVAADRALIIKVQAAVVECGGGGNRLPGLRWCRQPPGAQGVSGFEHQVPVQRRMIMFEDDIARHGAFPGGA